MEYKGKYLKDFGIVSSNTQPYQGVQVRKIGGDVNVVITVYSESIGETTRYIKSESEGLCKSVEQHISTHSHTKMYGGSEAMRRQHCEILQKDNFC